MISGDRPTHLLSLVSLAGILALLSFALWPVFLTSLGREWGLSNTDIGLEPRFIDMVFEILDDLQKKDGKTIIMVEQNAKKGLAFADIGYVLVSGETAIADKGNDLLANPDVGRLFLGG